MHTKAIFRTLYETWQRSLFLRFSSLLHGTTLSLLQFLKALRYLCLDEACVQCERQALSLPEVWTSRLHSSQFNLRYLKLTKRREMTSSSPMITLRDARKNWGAGWWIHGKTGQITIYYNSYFSYIDHPGVCALITSCESLFWCHEVHHKNYNRQDRITCSTVFFEAVLGPYLDSTCKHENN